MSESDDADLQVVVQAAVDATSTAYTADAGIDVEQRLRRELVAHGVEVDDDQWVAEVAHGIRSGHGVLIDPVASDPPPRADQPRADQPRADQPRAGQPGADLPGSMGGDNGGG